MNRQSSKKTREWLRSPRKAPQPHWPSQLDASQAYTKMPSRTHQDGCFKQKTNSVLAAATSTTIARSGSKPKAH